MGTGLTFSSGQEHMGVTVRHDCPGERRVVDPASAARPQPWSFFPLRQRFPSSHSLHVEPTPLRGTPWLAAEGGGWRGRG